MGGACLRGMKGDLDHCSVCFWSLGCVVYCLESIYIYYVDVDSNYFFGSVVWFSPLSVGLWMSRDPLENYLIEEMMTDTCFIIMYHVHSALIIINAEIG